MAGDTAATSWPDAVIVETTSGEAGAVALAILRHTGVRLPDEALARLHREIRET